MTKSIALSATKSGVPILPGDQEEDIDAKNKRFAALYEEHLAIEAEDAWRVGEVGYICRTLVQATLPYKEPKGAPPAWGRSNGKVSLVIQPGYYMQPETTIVGTRKRTVQTPVSFGYPYGSIPRLLLAWIGRDVTKHKQREIRFGKSLNSFMAQLGMQNPTGGKNGSITRMREQSRRLFASKIALVDNPNINSIDWRSESFQIADKTQIWWDARDPHQDNLFESSIFLSERFFEEYLHSPVPVDMRALKALKGSPSALDLYCYMTYKMFTLRREQVIPWEALAMQFGSEAANIRKFRWQFNKALREVLVVYPGARAESIKDGLILRPSPTSIRSSDVQRRIG